MFRWPVTSPSAFTTTPGADREPPRQQSFQDGSNPELWLNSQQLYDLRRAEADLAEELAAIPTLTALE
jgi:hypothetical protein